jgi:hypothetical protein
MRGKKVQCYRKRKMAAMQVVGEAVDRIVKTAITFAMLLVLLTYISGRTNTNSYFFSNASSEKVTLTIENIRGVIMPTAEAKEATSDSGTESGSGGMEGTGNGEESAGSGEDGTDGSGGSAGSGEDGTDGSGGSTGSGEDGTGDDKENAGDVDGEENGAAGSQDSGGSENAEDTGSSDNSGDQ